MANKTVSALESELREEFNKRFGQLEGRINNIPVVQDFKGLPIWVQWTFVGLLAAIIAGYVWFGIKANQVDRRLENVVLLQQQYDSLQMATAAQHLITLALLKKDSLQSLSYEGTVKYNNQQREYEKIKTDKEIAAMRDLINRREYDVLLARYWAD